MLKLAIILCLIAFAVALVLLAVFAGADPEGRGARLGARFLGGAALCFCAAGAVARWL